MKEAVFIVLLLDSSGSIDQYEWSIQIEGYQAAMENPHIIALTEKFDVEFAMIQFSEEPNLITDFTDREGVLAALNDVQQITTNDHTCINHGLSAARNLVFNKPGRRIIDLATDGIHTIESCPGMMPEELTRRFLYDEITVNGLQLPYGQSNDDYVFEELFDIATGFVIPTNGWEDVINATTRKLFVEISRDSWPEEREAHRPASCSFETDCGFDMRQVWKAESPDLGN